MWGRFGSSIPAQPIVGGMSGSPVISPDGHAIGICCASGQSDDGQFEGGPNPRLLSNLPGWILRDVVKLRKHEPRR
jgi:hypothetical protein